MRKTRIAIQTRADGVITGYMVYTGESVPQGYTAIVDLDDGLIVGGPQVVQAYKYADGAIVQRTAKDRRRDSRSFRKLPAETEQIYYPSAERFAKDVVQELSAGARRTREIVLIVFSLALALGVASSALVTYVSSPTPSVLLAMLLAGALRSLWLPST